MNGYGWHWSYGTHAQRLADDSVAIVEANGQRTTFWKNASGSGWTAAPFVKDTLAAVAGGGYALTRQDQSVWTFDADKRIGRNHLGHQVTLRPFMGVMGMPPDEPGILPTAPPRPTGGNIDTVATSLSPRAWR